MNYDGQGVLTGCRLFITALVRWSVFHKEEVKFLRSQVVLCLIAALAEG